MEMAKDSAADFGPELVIRFESADGDGGVDFEVDDGILSCLFFQKEPKIILLQFSKLGDRMSLKSPRSLLRKFEKRPEECG